MAELLAGEMHFDTIHVDDEHLGLVKTIRDLGYQGQIVHKGKVIED